ncbi:unnamed protein product, partial [Rotaria sp. Silwood1]
MTVSETTESVTVSATTKTSSVATTEKTLTTIEYHAGTSSSSEGTTPRSVETTYGIESTTKVASETRSQSQETSPSTTLRRESSSSSSEETSTVIESTTSHMTEETTKEFCEHMEYIDTLIASNSVTTKPEDISNKEDFIKNGVNFADTNPIVVIDMPSEGVVVHDVKVPSNNVEEIMVSFTTVSGD